MRSDALRFGDRWREELVLEKGLRNYGTDPNRSAQPGHGGDQGDKTTRLHIEEWQQDGES